MSEGKGFEEREAIVQQEQITIDREMYDHADKEKHTVETGEGLTEDVVRKISAHKNEPEWILQKRLKGFEFFNKTKMPNWGPDLSKLDLNKIRYFVVPDAQHNAQKWEDVPDDIKNTFDRLGIPEAEQRSLSGVGAQYDSMVIYHNLQEELQKQGVIFEDMDIAVQKYPELIKEYFMSNCIPIHDHKFIMLHAAVWSGGTFIYVPKNVKVPMPLQAYFRMNAQKGGQFEHTLIIVDEGAELHYVEGCSAPQYGVNSIHAGCVEIFVKKGAKCRYSSVENWSKNTYNLNTKRAIVEEDGIIEWVGGNLGSGVTMLYPCSILKGKRARADHLAIAFAGNGQHQDTGAKVVHNAPDTTSRIVSKSISKDGGIASYRGFLLINEGAVNAKSNVECDALILDEKSKTNTYPTIKIKENKSDVGHEATVGRISDDHVFYLMSRGLSKEQAMQMIVNGFMEPIIRELPLEYAVEMNKLIELEMEGSVG